MEFDELVFRGLELDKWARDSCAVFDGTESTGSYLNAFAAFGESKFPEIDWSPVRVLAGNDIEEPVRQWICWAIATVDGIKERVLLEFRTQRIARLGVCLNCSIGSGEKLRVETMEEHHAIDTLKYINRQLLEPCRYKLFSRLMNARTAGQRQIPLKVHNELRIAWDDIFVGCVLRTLRSVLKDSAIMQTGHVVELEERAIIYYFTGTGDAIRIERVFLVPSDAYEPDNVLALWARARDGRASHC